MISRVRPIRFPVANFVTFAEILGTPTIEIRRGKKARWKLANTGVKSGSNLIYPDLGNRVEWS